MRIKKFNQINESQSNYNRAIDAGYKVGDRVHNNITGTDMTIIPDENYDMVSDDNDRCTISAVGENIKTYSKVNLDNPNDQKSRKIFYSNERLKDDISQSIFNYYITKDELIKYINSL